MFSERIAVCGLGKLGLCIAATLADAGFEVTGIDCLEETVHLINSKQIVTKEPGLQTMLQKVTLKATTSYQEAVRNSDACFFIVPTPSLQDGTFDNSYLINAITKVAEEAKKLAKRNYLFVINSTVVPGSCEEVFKPILEAYLEKLGFGLCYKPEFIALGTVLENLLTPDLILIGESDSVSGSAVQKIYNRFSLTGAVKRMALTEAELAKISLNCFVTMKISFANQLAIAAEEFDADPKVILDAIGKDSRIGFRCLLPGLPFAGPCFPRDNKMFRSISEFAPLADATDAINRMVKERVFEQVLDFQVDNKCKKLVGILGTAYKAGCTITDESLGTWLEDQLIPLNYTIRTFDPDAPCRNTFEEVLQCPVVIVASTHEIFRNLSIKAETCLIDPAKVASKVTVQ